MVLCNQDKGRLKLIGRKIRFMSVGNYVSKLAKNSLDILHDHMQGGEEDKKNSQVIFRTFLSQAIEAKFRH